MVGPLRYRENSMTPNVTMATYVKSNGSVWPKEWNYAASRLFVKWDFAFQLSSNGKLDEIILDFE